MRYLHLLVILVVFGSMVSGCDQIKYIQITPPSTPTDDVPPMTVTLTPTIYDGYCSWVWGDHPAPAASAALMQALQDVTLVGVQGEVSVYGEVCIDMVTNAVVTFIPRQSNFLFHLDNVRAGQERTLGEWVEKLLTVIENFEAQELSGTDRGQIQLQYGTADEVQTQIFDHNRARDLIREGLHAAELWQALKQ